MGDSAGGCKGQNPVKADQLPVSAQLSSRRAVLRPARPPLPAGTPLLPPTTTVLCLGQPVLPLGNGLLPAGPAVLCLGRPLLRFGRALLSPGRALLWGPSAFPDGFCTVSGDPGPNPGDSWSKRDSPEPSQPEITTSDRNFQVGMRCKGHSNGHQTGECGGSVAIALPDQSAGGCCLGEREDINR